MPKTDNAPLVKRLFSLDCSDAVEPSMTQQHFRDECDINRIMAKYERTGQIDFMRDVKSGRYASIADAPGYHEAMNIVVSAQEAFEALPSKIRAEFDNSPGKFLQFVSDPKNSDKAAEIGLTEKKNPAPAAPASLDEIAATIRSALDGLPKHVGAADAKPPLVGG